MNQYSLYMNSGTGKDSDSLHFGTLWLSFLQHKHSCVGYVYTNLDTFETHLFSEFWPCVQTETAIPKHSCVSDHTYNGHWVWPGCKIFCKIKCHKNSWELYYVSTICIISVSFYETIHYSFFLNKTEQLQPSNDIFVNWVCIKSVLLCMNWFWFLRTWHSSNNWRKCVCSEHHMGLRGLSLTNVTKGCKGTVVWKAFIWRWSGHVLCKWLTSWTLPGCNVHD